MTKKKMPIEVRIPGGPTITVDLVARAVYVQIKEGQVRTTDQLTEGVLIDNGDKGIKGVEILY